jgi:hypothetical protein
MARSTGLHSAVAATHVAQKTQARTKPALPLRWLDLPGLRRARRESRRRAKLRVKRPLQNRAGRLLNLCHRHQPPAQQSQEYLSHARRKNNSPQLQLAVSISATHSDPTATATPPGGIRRR